MGGRLAIAIVLVLLLVPLAACGPDARALQLCRDIATTLTGTAPGIGDGADREASFEAGGHRVTCRFADAIGAPELVAVELDGQALSVVQLALLQRSMRLPLSPSLLAEAAPDVPIGAELAYLAQQLLNGVMLGAVLGLVAVGYTLVYAVTGSIPFAYGELYMIGAILLVDLVFAIGATGLAPVALVLSLAFAAAAGLTAPWGIGMERLAWRPVAPAGLLPTLIAAIGLAGALREAVRLTHGSGNKWLPAVVPGRLIFAEASGFGVIVGYTQILILAAAVAIAFSLMFIMRSTRLGRALRACADDPGAAALLGVDVGRTIAAAFLIGAALAALAGGLVALHYGQADFFMGYLAGFKALTAALLGGFGSIGGALLGGLAIGIFEALWSAYLGLAYKDAAVVAVLILVLVLRPEGFFGSHIPRGRWRDSTAAPIMPRPSARNTAGSGRKVSSTE